MIGYHGTDIKNVNAIKSDNFNLSQSDDEWLGTGVYFFVEGVSDPKINSSKWAIANSWNNDLKLHNYKNYGIFSATILVDDEFFLDLTTKEGIETFNYLRDSFIKKIKQAGYKFRNGEFKDGHIINQARNFLKIDVVKGDFYIKFSIERIYNINFRIPNCTIIAVFSQNCIDIKSINIEKKGNIYETY